MGAVVLRDARNSSALTKVIERLTREFVKAETDRRHGDFELRPIFKDGICSGLKVATSAHENI